MSKTSMPCIFPRISKRSRPVACSRSVGMVPGEAPGGRRSDSVRTSIGGGRGVSGGGLEGEGGSGEEGTW